MSNTRKTCFAALALAVLLSACSGGSGGGASNREVDLTADLGSAQFVYAGPPPASDEIQNFKREFYDPLAGNDRCGQCHTPGGSAGTAFVDQTDVNNAWQVAKAVVNFDHPAASPAVLRVANGHNCWLGSDQTATCATTLTGYVERWASGVSQTESEVRLIPRRPVDPSGTRVLPPSADELDALGLSVESGTEIVGLLRTYCSECHAEDAAFPQSPYFASADRDSAYDALRTVIDLADPGVSRIVRRLDPEQHNCWSNNCGSDAQELEDAVARIAAVVPVTEVDPALVISKAQILEADGIIANSGGRFESNLVAKWEFREGQGTTTADTSGVLPEIPLGLSGDYSWMASWGVRFVNGKAQGSVSGSSKLYQLLTGTGEYTIEAWVAPDNVAQENAWIVGYAGGPTTRNFLVSQMMYNYEAYNRSTVTEDNNAGEPVVSTEDDDEIAQATLQHVVVTYDAVEGRRIFVNGMDTGAFDEAGGGLLTNWSEVFALVLGNDTSNTQPWAGAIRMVAIHNAVLTPEQIQQNFDVGVGQKYYLMFSVSELIEDSEGAGPGDEGACYRVDDDGNRSNYCYVVFQVSQFDDASYLFEEPFFANINPAGGSVDFDVQGIRIGVNGKLTAVGQAFTNVSAQATSALGQFSDPLAGVGTIIPLENGADQDIFFLAFDSAEGQTSPVDDGARRPFRYTLAGEVSSDIGVRTFDEINASFSRITGVSTASPTPSAVTGKTVSETFADVRRGLPANADFLGFSSAHQMSATQLASAYCDALVQSSSLSDAMFPAFNFNAPVDDPSHDWRDAVAAPLVDRAINTGLLEDSIRGSILDELVLLVTDDRDLKPYALIDGEWVPDPDPAVHNKRDGLMFCLNDAPCPASRTADVVKAVCTTVLGSAVVMAQ
jgi:mono/diheme cytochrome c family protein